MNETVPLQSHNSDAQLREAAINRYLLGERPSTICQQLGHSRAWFYKTLHRYQTGGRAALQSRSRRPQHTPRRTAEPVEAAIVRIRQTILAGEDPILRYSNIGAATIAAELEKAGLRPPSLTTINRILRRHGLQRPRVQRKSKRQLPADYPWPTVTQPNQMHLLDFVNRTTSTIRRVYACNLLDQARQWPFLRLVTHKNREQVSQFLVSAWQEVGLPQALYIDNDAVWRGSSFGQRSFSFIVRLCLLLGIEVIFIPPYTPEANPLIESFNGIWERNFWQRTAFHSWTQMEGELPYFESWCRFHRPLPEPGRRCADQLQPDFVPRCLPLTFDQHRQSTLPLSEGFLHFIRFVEPDGSFSLLNEVWTLESTTWADKTIRATIDLAQQQLLVYHQANTRSRPTLVQRFVYQLPEVPIPVTPDYQQPTHALWLEPELCDC